MGENLKECRALPVSWQSVRLDDICERIVGGGTPSTSVEEYWNGDIPWITSADIHGLRDIRPKKKISDRAIQGSATNLLRKGGIIVVTRVGLGKIAIAPFDICFSQDSQGLELCDSVVSNDYALLCLSKAVQGFKYESRGTTINGVTKKQLENLEIALPPLPEQHRIVAKIEELFSELDKGVEALKTAQQQLKIYRQAVLKWAFEGKLTNKNVVEGELPEGWKWVKIDFFLSDKRRGITTGPFGTMLKKSEHQNSGVPVLGIENIGEGMFQMPNKIFITTLKAQELNNFAVSANDIIISRSGTVGEICAVPANMRGSIISTNLIKVSINQEVLDDKYFVYLFQGGKVRQQVFDLCKGSSRAFLNQTILTSLDFPYCPLPEQRAIVSEIESRLSVADKIEEAISQSLNQAEALRQSILKKAFAGKLVPQDPNDEPAEKLLERIRAERAALAPMMVTMKRKGAGRKAAEQGVAQRAVRRANKKGV